MSTIVDTLNTHFIQLQLIYVDKSNIVANCIRAMYRELQNIRDLGPSPKTGQTVGENSDYECGFGSGGGCCGKVLKLWMPLSGIFSLNSIRATSPEKRRSNKDTPNGLTD